MDVFFVKITAILVLAPAALGAAKTLLPDALYERLDDWLRRRINEWFPALMAPRMLFAFWLIAVLMMSGLVVWGVAADRHRFPAFTLAEVYGLMLAGGWFGAALSIGIVWIGGRSRIWAWPATRTIAVFAPATVVITMFLLLPALSRNGQAFVVGAIGGGALCHPRIPNRMASTSLCRL